MAMPDAAKRFIFGLGSEHITYSQKATMAARNTAAMKVYTSRPRGVGIVHSFLRAGDIVMRHSARLQVGLAR